MTGQEIHVATGHWTFSNHFELTLHDRSKIINVQANFRPYFLL